MFVYLRVHVCMREFVRVYVYMRVYRYIYICMFVPACICIRVFLFLVLCMWTRVGMGAVCVCVGACMSATRVSTYYSIYTYQLCMSEMQVKDQDTKANNNGVTMPTLCLCNRSFAQLDTNISMRVFNKKTHNL